nr:zinc finger, CCHC-type [Tanacetum cinerariifolium]
MVENEMSFEEAIGKLTAYEERIKSQDTLEANDQDKLLMASSNNKTYGKWQEQVRVKELKTKASLGVMNVGIQVNKEPDSPLVELDPPIKEEPNKEKPQVASKVQPLEETGAQNPVSASDAFPEGEEGWQAALTYKDKSVPSSAKEFAEESDRDESNSSLEVGPVQMIGPTQEIFYKPFFESVAKALRPGGVCVHTSWQCMAPYAHY